MDNGLIGSQATIIDMQAATNIPYKSDHLQILLLSCFHYPCMTIGCSFLGAGLMKKNHKMTIIKRAEIVNLNISAVIATGIEVLLASLITIPI